IFLIATVRSGDAAPDLVTGLWREGRLERGDLADLSRADLGTLLHLALGGPVEAGTRPGVCGGAPGDPPCAPGGRLCAPGASAPEVGGGPGGGGAWAGLASGRGGGWGGVRGGAVSVVVRRPGCRAGGLWCRGPAAGGGVGGPREGGGRESEALTSELNSLP